MPHYKRDKEIQGLVESLMASEEFILLHTADVTVDVLMVFPDEGKGTQALMHNGYPAHAVIKISPLEKRALGQRDALLLIDATFWLSATDRQKNALLHHELSHLTVVRDKQEEIAFDKMGRPKLRMRLHDVQIGWFARTAELYGADSVEVQQAQQIVGTYRQTVFAWLDDVIDEQAERKSAVNGLTSGTDKHAAPRINIEMAANVVADRLQKKLNKIRGQQAHADPSPA